MTGFFIKKAFFDGWDNLIALVLFNLGYMVALFIGLGLSMAVGRVNWLVGYLFLLLVAMGCAVLMGGTAAVTHNFSDYKRGAWSEFRHGIVRNIRHSLLYGLLLVVALLNAFLIIPFYGSFGTIYGYILSVVMIWVEVVLIIALPYYFPLMNLLPADNAKKTLKKCFIIVGGNLGFTFFLLLYRLVCLALTVFTLGLIPGVAGMQLASQDAMKLLMYKYDYLEENPDADPRRIPWADLLYDEKEKVGPRSLKSMIFPWK